MTIIFTDLVKKGGEINKAEKYMNMAPGDAMGYNAKETDSLYKHIPFYIKLQRGTKKSRRIFLSQHGRM